MFRTLSTDEEKTFRQWAQEHDEEDNEIDPRIIHPVIRDEWAIIAIADADAIARQNRTPDRD